MEEQKLIGVHIEKDERGKKLSINKPYIQKIHAEKKKEESSISFDMKNNSSRKKPLRANRIC